jgi:aerobic-type carbon monoxide dehydrogenase small subunit (CoxS/CutS family)
MSESKKRLGKPSNGLIKTYKISQRHTNCGACRIMVGNIDGKAVWSCGEHNVLYFND